MQILLKNVLCRFVLNDLHKHSLHYIIKTVIIIVSNYYFFGFETAAPPLDHSGGLLSPTPVVNDNTVLASTLLLHFDTHTVH